MRKDNKKPNNKKSVKTVSVVKALYKQGIPVKIIAELFGVAESTVVMWGVGCRQALVKPAEHNEAIAELYRRFKKLMEDLPEQAMKSAA